MSDFADDSLNPIQKAISQVILECLREDVKNPSGGGCKAFYSPQEWIDRGERYGHDSFLVVCHDGGDLAPYFSLDYRQYDFYNKMENALNQIGYYQEQCTSWYSAIYPKM